MQSDSKRRGFRFVVRFLVVVAGLYLLLLIPEPSPPVPKGAGKSPFYWQQDSVWAELEKQFQQARAVGCETLAASINDGLAAIRQNLDSLAEANLPPSAPVFGLLETNFFQLAPMIGACPEQLPEYLSAFARMRRLVKQQSEHWPANSPEARVRRWKKSCSNRRAKIFPPCWPAMMNLPPRRGLWCRA